MNTNHQQSILLPSSLPRVIMNGVSIPSKRSKSPLSVSEMRVSPEVSWKIHRDLTVPALGWVGRNNCHVKIAIANYCRGQQDRSWNA